MDKSDQMNKRMLLFLYGCIPTRAIIALLTKKYYNTIFINFISYFTLLVGIGFFTIYLFDLRKTGLETGGAPIWWNHLRPIHGLLYLTASWFIFFGKREQAWIPLTIDVSFGLTAFLIKHQKHLFG